MRNVRNKVKRLVSRLPQPLQDALYKGGQRSDRLRDPAAVIDALSVNAGDAVADLGPGYGHTPYELLVQGHGDAFERARLFILL